MKRRAFFRNTGLSALGLGLIGPSAACTPMLDKVAGQAKNIIFLVSDGMSIGTLQMADLLSRQKYGRSSRWMALYNQNKGRRALMDTASLNSFVTDSAAGGSAWGGGQRVNNGSLNVGPNGEQHKPILQKFKEMGKSVGCVTTVPITHATPASFCVNNESRKNQPDIAQQYLGLRFDVMLGGGLEYFHPEKRKDRQDLFAAYSADGYQLVRTKNEMEGVDSGPVMGVFHESALPYTLDQSSDEGLQKSMPTLAEMTRFAIDRMKGNEKGFVMQVEGGKVDWAAHANDIGGLLYDQIAFDEAVGVALDFAEQDRNTLVIITTDHGNANPGLVKHKNVDQMFERLYHFKHSNEWVFDGLKTDASAEQLRERIAYAQNLELNKEEAQQLHSAFQATGKAPRELMAEIQKSYTSVGWVSTDHTSDFVELAMFGPGSEELPHFVQNHQLHQFMLEACGQEVSG